MLMFGIFWLIESTDGKSDLLTIPFLLGAGFCICMATLTSNYMSSDGPGSPISATALRAYADRIDTNRDAELQRQRDLLERQLNSTTLKESTQ